MAHAPSSPHGPRFAETLDNMSGWLIFGWILGIFFWFTTGYIFLKHRHELEKHHRTVLRMLYIRIVGLPMLFATTALATLFFPRPAYIFEILRALYECWCLIAFGTIMTELMSIVSKPGGGYASPEEFRRRALALAATVPPQKYWSAPPLGCLCRPITPPHKFDSKLLTTCRRLVSQYLYVRPLSGLINLWIQVDDSSQTIQEKTGVTESTLTGYIEGASMLIAMQGLFMMYWCCRGPLKNYHVGLKFVAIKAVIFLSVVQSFTLGSAIKEPSADAFYDQEARIQLWNAALLLIESAPVALLIYFAFPPTELQEAEDMLVNGGPSDAEAINHDLEKQTNRRSIDSVSQGGDGEIALTTTETDRNYGAIKTSLDDNLTTRLLSGGEGLSSSSEAQGGEN